jgi:hypothetical protein
VVSVRARLNGLPLGAIFLGIAVAGTAAVALLGLDRLPIAVCTFRAVTGLPCLTCGATRAAARLAFGDVAGAFAMNPLATAGALALVPWGIADLALMTRGRALVVEVARPAAAWALRGLAVAAVVVNWAYLVVAGR